MVKRIARELAKWGLYALFVAGQRAGMNILPLHFYSQIPSIKKLRGSHNWRSAMSMAGVMGTDLTGQLQALDSWVSPVRKALSEADLYSETVASSGGEGGYGEIESLVLYAYIRARKPTRILQIGAGVSTAVILRAAGDADYHPRLLCVDPYPTKYLKDLWEKSEIELISEPAQEVDLDSFLDLRAGDLFFVDSTHTVSPGSEVNRIILEILPRLAEGVDVHFHDIYFPYDYQRHVIAGEMFFQAESSLLHAFLACNSRYMIMVSLSMLHYGEPKRLRKLIGRYDPQSNEDGLAALGGGRHFPSSLWLRCVG